MSLSFVLSIFLGKPAKKGLPYFSQKKIFARVLYNQENGNICKQLAAKLYFQEYFILENALTDESLNFDTPTFYKNVLKLRTLLPFQIHF